MLTEEISPEASGFYPGIVLDYLDHKQDLRSLYRLPAHIDSFTQSIQERPFEQTSRELLHQVLTVQYKGIELSATSPVFANLEALLGEKTFTVTTGHQLCLNTGPVYFIYKIIHAIRLAEELNLRFPDHRIVPVYWMASEDHDFDEINSMNVAGINYKWNKESKGQAVGRLNTAGIEEVFEVLGKNPDFEISAALLKMISEFYSGSTTLSEATRKLVHFLFEDYGLLVLDPDDASLKITLKPLITADVIAGQSIDALNKTNETLRKLHYKLQVHGRDINFFYLGEYGRKLIRKEGDQYHVVDTDLRFSEDAIRREIESFPERFSPNVVMRPLYQEIILPNLAYVGGPGEISYWLQLKGVFDVYKIPFPVLLPRNSFAILSHPLRHKFEKLGIETGTLFLRKDQVKAASLKSLWPTTEEETFKRIDDEIQALVEQLEPLDNTISSNLLHYKAANKDFLHALSKLIKGKKQLLHEKELNEINLIYSYLFRENIPVERIHNFLCYAPANPKEFIRFIYEHSDPVMQNVKLLAY